MKLIEITNKINELEALKTDKCLTPTGSKLLDELNYVVKNLNIDIVSESSPKDAILKVYLKADSGYTSNEEVRISPDQWGAIMKILHPQK